MVTVLSPRVQVTVTDRADRAIITVAGPGGKTQVQLDADGCRLRVGVLLAPRSRPIDVSIQPTVLACALELAGGGGVEERAALGEWASSFCARSGLWVSDSTDLVRGLGGASFPLLGQVYDRGASTVGEIPRWAAPALVAAQARSAARAVFGSAASAPVTAALAASLVPGADGAPPALHPLALALMGRPVLGPDELARVLRARSDGPALDPGTWPSVDDVHRFQNLAPELGSARVERLLTDAASRPDGPPMLARTTQLLAGVPCGLRSRLPRRLSDLHARCLELTPIDPHPAGWVRAVAPSRRAAPRRVTRALEQPGPAPGAAAAAPAPAPAPARRATAPARALAAPFVAGYRTPAAGTGLAYPPAIWALHGHDASPSLRLVLPRSVDELRAWGGRLRNCLGSYTAAAAAGESVLVGVERHDTLAYCAEWTPATRSIRQLLGVRNRPVPGADAATICSALLAAGLIDRDRRSNRPWLELVRSMSPGPT